MSEMIFNLEDMVAGKAAWRETQIRMPYADKLRVMDRMRERDQSIGSARAKIREQIFGKRDQALA